MVWFIVMEIFSTLLEWVRVSRKSETEKTLEILLLRRQLAIVERTLDKPIRPSRGEKLTLVILTAKLKASSLNKLLIVNQAHLRRVTREFVAHHNSPRPHQRIDQQIPVPHTAPIGSGPFQCRQVLGGIIHDYYRDAV